MNKIFIMEDGTKSGKVMVDVAVQNQDFSFDVYFNKFGELMVNEKPKYTNGRLLLNESQMKDVKEVVEHKIAKNDFGSFHSLYDGNVVGVDGL